MDSNYAVGFFLIAALLLGGVFLFARRPVEAQYQSMTLPAGQQSTSNIRLVSEGEPPHYRNKETRYIKYNDLNLPVEIEIVRDYTVS
jgi:hypothetical protein